MSRIIFAFLTGSALFLLFLPIPAHTADLAVLYAYLYKPVCDRHVRDYDSENSVNYAAWRRAKLSEFEIVERDRQSQTQRDEILSNVDSLSPTEKRDIEKQCHGLADLFQTAAVADSRFSSPESTWALFRSSLQTVNRKTLLSCLVSTAKTDFVEFLRGASDQQVRGIADSIVEFKLSTLAADTGEGTVLKKNGDSFPVSFGRLGKNWKIGGMNRQSY